MSDPIEHPHDAVVEKHRARVGGTLADLLQGIGVLLIGAAVLLYVLWQILATVHAVPFDSDGVRCYDRGGDVTCIKTAEPAR